MSAVEPSTTLGGRYRLLAKIGVGGMGEVWEAQDTVLERRVAVKVVKDIHLHDEVMLARFEREAQTAARLVHPGLATVYDYGTSDDGVFLVMELLAGETLGQRLRRGPIDPSEAAVLGAEVADALHVAHQAGVVHRDVKPSNIMLTERGARVMDFGIASGLGDPLTATGLVLGTPNYLAPERIRGQSAGPEADVYALGTVLYEALTGRRAFEGPTPAEVALAHLHAEPPDASAVNRAVPADVGRLCREAMAKQPADRPTAAALAAQLRRADSDAPATEATVVTHTPTAAFPAAAPAPGPVPPTPAAGGGRSGAWIGALALLALVLVGGAWLLVGQDDDAGGEQEAGAAATTAPPDTASPTTGAPATTAPPATTTPPTTTATPPTLPVGAASDDAAGAAITYVETLAAGDFEAAWALTTPDFQAAQDRDSWEGFWSFYDSVELAGEPQVDEGSGTVVLPLSFDGSVEDYTLFLVQAGDGSWLIDGPVGR